MNHLASGTDKRLKSLIDLVAADPVGLFSGAGNTPSDVADFGPCVVDDTKAPPLTPLGPPVGDE